MTYSFKNGSMIRCDPQKAGEVCEKLAASNSLTAKSLVNVSRPKDAPIHDAFEWDDTKAAELYRETQARLIIRSIVIVDGKTDEKKEDVQVRAFFHVEKKSPEYKHIAKIVRTKSDKERLYENMIRDIITFRAKYRIVHEYMESEENQTAIEMWEAMENFIMNANVGEKAI